MCVHGILKCFSSKLRLFLSLTAGMSICVSLLYLVVSLYLKLYLGSLNLHTVCGRRKEGNVLHRFQRLHITTHESRNLNKIPIFTKTIKDCTTIGNPP